MKVVTENAPPPQELRIAWHCERFRCLPEPGGLFDQDYVLIRRMVTLDNVHDAVDGWKHRYVGPAIHRMPEQVRRILRFLLDNGIEFNQMTMNIIE